MGDVAAVLLVPGEGDPHGLLREGACGAMPPTVRLLGGHWRNGWRNEGTLPAALVLAWDGKVVVEGCDRASRRRSHLNDDHAAGSAFHGDEDLGRLIRWIELQILPGGCGRMVLLDSTGREVQP